MGTGLGVEWGWEGLWGLDIGCWGWWAKGATITSSAVVMHIEWHRTRHEGVFQSAPPMRNREMSHDRSSPQ